MVWGGGAFVNSEEFAKSVGDIITKLTSIVTLERLRGSMSQTEVLDAIRNLVGSFRPSWVKLNPSGKNIQNNKNIAEVFVGCGKFKQISLDLLEWSNNFEGDQRGPDGWVRVPNTLTGETVFDVIVNIRPEMRPDGVPF